METLTPQEAHQRLTDLALDAENENYHTEAGKLFDLAAEVLSWDAVSTLVVIVGELTDDRFSIAGK